MGDAGDYDGIVWCGRYNCPILLIYTPESFVNRNLVDFLEAESK